MITDAFEGFAHSLRMLLEAKFRANELLFIDPHEAAGNIEQSLTNLLNAIHSLYDGVVAQRNVALDWYGMPETATVLAIRNARHHNSSNRIRGLYTYHLQQPNAGISQPYVYVDYPDTGDGGDTIDVPVSWFDIKNYLDLPSSESRLRPSVNNKIRAYLALELMDSYASAHHVREECVFLNVVPLIMNAGLQFVPVIKPFLNPRSNEAKWFSEHFDHILATNTQSHVVSKINILLPS